jgi:hypothetical protein
MLNGGFNDETAFASVGIPNNLGSPLIQLLMSDEIVPGTAPSYDLCKIIYSYHPLGAILTDAPIRRAQSQERVIKVPILAESRLIQQFNQTWETVGKVGATEIIHNVMSRSRTYGISSLGVGEVGKDQSVPLDIAKVDAADLYFNVLDPLNTAGSLVLNQDPNSPEFLKQGAIHVNGKEWHPSRTLAMMNENPLYIDWTNSAFGFVGRSVYQRALYPMKTYLQTMVTDQMVTQKAGLLVAKMKSPGAFIDNVMQAMFGWKRGAIKQGVTGQVLSIGTEEDVAAINMEHLEPAARFARENVLKNIASAAGMPASIIAQETLTAGFGEGSEDAKKEANYLNHIRKTMGPLYAFMDRIVQRKAWTREFYEALCVDYPDYKRSSYETALYEWQRAFSATWPNPIEEPDSEKAKNADVQLKAVIAIFEVMIGQLDPENKVNLCDWVAENVNERGELFASNLNIDLDALKAHFEEVRESAEAAANAEPGAPATFAGRA